MHAQQHAKKYSKFFNASDQAELRPNPHSGRTRHQAGPWCTQVQILLSACQISKFQNFHNFLNFHQPKGALFHQTLKISRILPYKKRFHKKGKEKKGTLVKRNKNRVTLLDSMRCTTLVSAWRECGCGVARRNWRSARKPRTPRPASSPQNRSLHKMATSSPSPSCARASASTWPRL